MSNWSDGVDTSRGGQSGERPQGNIRARGSSLAPGSVVGDGRYRLLAQFGVDQRAGAHFWRARDGQLRRDVALTILVGDPADAQAAARARQTLERAAHAGQFAHVAMARILDVLNLGDGISSNEGILGIIVADWTRSTDLLDLLGPGAQRPVAPATAARMTYALAEAVDHAHQSGLVLGIDHPQRLRVTPDGKLRIAFAGPLPDASLRDDVKALGAVLYLLLTGYWPLAGGPEGVPDAPRSPSNRVQPPQSLDSRIPSSLSSLAVRTLEDGDNGGIRTSSAILRMLGDTAEQEEQVARRKANNEPVDDSVAADGTVWTTKKPVKDAKRRRKLALGVTVIVVAAVGILAWGGMQLINFFHGDSGANGPKLNVAATTQHPSQSATPAPSEGGKAPPEQPSTTKATAQPVAPASIRLYNPNSSGDNPADAAKTIDGDPATVWQTDQYHEQLPALKPGLGLLATFDKPITLSKLKITTDSPGTYIEVRTTNSANPTLGQTRVVGSGEITGTHTTITLDKPVKSRYVLVWLTKLSPVDGEYQSKIGELTFIAKQ